TWWRCREDPLRRAGRAAAGGGSAGPPRVRADGDLPRQGSPPRVRGQRPRRRGAEGRGLQRRRDLRADGVHRDGRRAGAARCRAGDAAMRLEAVDAAGDALRERLGREPSGVLKTLYFRPELFGRPYSDALDLALRGPSDWTAGERELFAAFVSSLNQCPF